MSVARALSDHPMHVSPHFLGRQIASPVRRLVAFSLDVLVLFLPTVAAAAGFAML